MSNGAITFQRMKKVVLFVFVLTEKKRRKKYKVLFINMCHFIQAFKIAQPDQMGMGKNSTGKGKIVKSLLNHYNNGLVKSVN